MSGQRCSSSRDDRGVAAVEAAIVAPALIALLMLVVLAGRVSEADGNIRRAASEAARAASLVQDPAEAVVAARESVDVNLAAAGVQCRSLDVAVDTREFHAGGQVTVTVTCVASMRDVALIGVPGDRTFSAQEIEVIDRFRSGDQ